jgi:hypothetical protein
VRVLLCEDAVLGVAFSLESAVLSLCSAWFAAAGADEIGVGVVASGFAGIGFVFGLLFGDSLGDPFDDLLLAEARIFEAGDRSRTDGRLTLQIALKDRGYGRIGKSNQAKHHRVAADAVELVGLGVGDDIGFGVARIEKIGDGIGAAKGAFVVVRGGDQRDAGIVADAGALETNELLELGVGNIEGLEALNGARVHAGLVERAIVHHRGVVAAHREGEQPSADHEVRALHNIILWLARRARRGAGGQLCCRGTRPGGQVGCT